MPLFPGNTEVPEVSGESSHCHQEGVYVSMCVYAESVVGAVAMVTITLELGLELPGIGIPQNSP